MCALAQVEPPNAWLPTRSSSVHPFGSHPQDAAPSPAGAAVPRLTPEWYSSIYLSIYILGSRVEG